MKKVILALALIATPALAATDIVMHRDPGCGCCEKWAAQVKRALGREVRVVDDRNRLVKLQRPRRIGRGRSRILENVGQPEMRRPVPLRDSSLIPSPSLGLVALRAFVEQ